MGASLRVARGRGVGSRTAPPNRRSPGPVSSVPVTKRHWTGRRRRRFDGQQRELLGPYVVEEQLILWEHPAFGDLAVLEPIEAMCTPFHYPAASGSSSRADNHTVFVVRQHVVDRDFKRVVSKVPATSHVLHQFSPAPIDSRDLAATGDVPNDVCGENCGEGRIVPPTTRLVLMSQQSRVRMHGLGRPAVTSREVLAHRRGRAVMP
jgi:hypothetical protein